MQANVGSEGRQLRLIVGLLLLDLALAGVVPAWIGWLAAWPLLTGAGAWCPVAALLGTSTLHRGTDLAAGRRDGCAFDAVPRQRLGHEARGLHLLDEGRQRRRGFRPAAARATHGLADHHEAAR